MITTGVTGSAWRASVTPWGAITPWDDDVDGLDWFVAADDRFPLCRPTEVKRHGEGGNHFLALLPATALPPGAAEGSRSDVSE